MACSQNCGDSIRCGDSIWRASHGPPVPSLERNFSELLTAPTCAHLRRPAIDHRTSAAPMSRLGLFGTPACSVPPGSALAKFK